MKRSSALALLTVAAMGLSACGSEDSNDSDAADSSANASAQQESTNQATNRKEDTEKTTKPSKKNGPNPTPPASNHGSGHNSAAESNNRAAEPTRGKRKRSSSNGGSAYPRNDCGVTANGAEISVPLRTSCEFADVIYAAALKPTYVYRSSDPNVTAIPRASITVTAPDSGDTHAMDCYVGSDGSTLSCQVGKSNDYDFGAGFTLKQKKWSDYLTIATPQ
ncbi:hypothetical protein ACKFRT_05605 [Corynebacterium sp. YSMAA1_1_F7]|uniref:hypothetical protein n=1 Tax=Corynebacterium sp. YSMAA1_1_F7 TaxID=3383590 RepID=UPI0038CFBF0B